MQLRIFAPFASLVFTCTTLLASAPFSQAEVIVSEDFTYPDGGLNGQNGGKGFSGAWTSSINVTGGVPTGNSASTRSLAPPFRSTGTLWLSFVQSFDHLLIGTTAEDVVRSAAATVSNATAPTIDHVALATSRMTTAEAAWTAGDWEQVRAALSEVFNDKELSPQWRSIAHLRYARSYQAAGDPAKASTIFGNIADQ